jgi:hypothetical protein
MCGVGTAGVGTNGGSCTGPDYITTGATPKVVVTESSQSDPYPQVLTDIANNQLQQVSWVIPAGQFSDHAYSNTGCGPSWVTTVVNAIGASSYWNNTVIIVTWDDWGGWYDHVPPPQVIDDGKSWGSGYVYGFRVPIMVISPYITKSGYISHNTHDFGSILLYMENTFGLPSLGFADAPLIPAPAPIPTTTSHKSRVEIPGAGLASLKPEATPSKDAQPCIVQHCYPCRFCCLVSPAFS